MLSPEEQRIDQLERHLGAAKMKLNVAISALFFAIEIPFLPSADRETLKGFIKEIEGIV